DPGRQEQRESNEHLPRYDRPDHGGTRMMRAKVIRLGMLNLRPRLAAPTSRALRFVPYIAALPRLRTRRFRRRRRQAVPPRREPGTSAELVAFVGDARYAAAG